LETKTRRGGAVAVASGTFTDNVFGGNYAAQCAQIFLFSSSRCTQ